ncbi:hypothetical protein HZB60_07555 [candidate division KSB1 bacterium]|nr:hypothetical protein [candidate division KSB1 bacterium]
MRGRFGDQVYSIGRALLGVAFSFCRLGLSSGTQTMQVLQILQLTEICQLMFFMGLGALEMRSWRILNNVRVVAVLWSVQIEAGFGLDKVELR